MEEKFKIILVEFSTIKIQLSVWSNDEHVGETEQLKCNLKVCVEGLFNNIKFTRFLGCTIVLLENTCIFEINVFLTSRWVAKNVSPFIKVTVKKVNFQTHCHIYFGQFYLTHEQHVNSMVYTTTRYIAMKMEGNTQIGY